MCASGLSALVAAREIPPSQVCLQLVTTTACASGMVAPVERRKVRTKCKVQRSGPTSALVGTGCIATCNYNHHHHQPDRTAEQHNASIGATCVRAIGL